MTIKKAYQPLISLLEANQNSKVSTILEQAIALASAKTVQVTASHVVDGNVVAIRCYYHQLWMSPNVVEFGKKASSATGFNNMCKEGVSKWTKQQREAKKAKDQLLISLAEGEIESTDLPALLADIKEAQDVIVPLENGIGYETLEELLEAA